MNDDNDMSLLLSRLNNLQESFDAMRALMDERTRERDANARLIAAAPELLAACRAMVSWNDFAADEDSDLESLYEEAIRRARTAITKAEGGG